MQYSPTGERCCLLAFTRKRGNMDQDGGPVPRARRPGRPVQRFAFVFARGGALLSGYASVALPLKGDDVGVVDDSVDERGGARAIGEEASPLRNARLKVSMLGRPCSRSLRPCTSSEGWYEGDGHSLLRFEPLDTRQFG